MSFRITGSRGLDKLKKLIERGSDTQSALARLYPVYQMLQIARFKSENVSEGYRWNTLSPAYARSKLRRYSKYPESGNKIMVATGMLAGAVIGPNEKNPFPSGVSKHRAIFTKQRLVVQVQQSGRNPEGNPFEYASYAAEERPFMNFSKKSVQAMSDELRRFVMEVESR